MEDVDDLPAEDVDDALDVLSFGVGVGLEIGLEMEPLGPINDQSGLRKKRHLQKNRYNCKYIRKRLINEAENSNSLSISLSRNS